MTVHVQHGPVCAKRQPAVKVTNLPGRVFPPPVDGMAGAAGDPPGPACVRPPRAVPITACVDKLGENRLGQRARVDVECRDRHRMTPLLVVENEALAASAAQFHLARGERQPLRRQRVGDVGPLGRRITQILECHPPSLDVHQFVIQAQLGEISERLVEPATQADGHGGGDPLCIFVDCGRCGQGQIPAAIVRNAGGVVQRVGRRQQAGRKPAVGPCPQAPALLKPDDVPVFPQRRIQMRGAWPQPAVRRQAVDQCPQLAARLRQPIDELVRSMAADGSGSVHAI